MQRPDQYEVFLKWATAVVYAFATTVVLIDLFIARS